MLTKLKLKLFDSGGCAASPQGEFSSDSNWHLWLGACEKLEAPEWCAAAASGTFPAWRRFPHELWRSVVLVRPEWNEAWPGTGICTGKENNRGSKACLRDLPPRPVPLNRINAQTHDRRRTHVLFLAPEFTSKGAEIARSLVPDLVDTCCPIFAMGEPKRLPLDGSHQVSSHSVG